MTETGYGRSAVSEALTALQARGWITQTRKGSGTSGKTSVYELVPDAPSSTAGAVPPDTGSGTAGADQPQEVGPVERTSWSAGADSVVPLERTPTDPDIRSGSDPFRSDQEEVRYAPNHLEHQDETAPYGRSLAIAGTEAPGGADGRGHRGPSLVARASGTGPDSDPWGGSPSDPATAAPQGSVSLQPTTTVGHPADPWASEPAERAAKHHEPATATGTYLNPFEDPFWDE